MSHHIAISGMVRCTDSTDPVMSSIFLNFNVNAADALDVISIHVGNADGDYCTFNSWTPNKKL